jgi:plastocyanin
LPEEGAQIPSENITIEVKVSNFKLANKLGQPNVPGEGHVHYYIDVPVPKIADKPATTAAGTFAPTSNTTFIWKNVKPGKHNLSVQLVNNDHTPIIPLVYNQVNVTLTAPILKTMSLDSVTIGLTAKDISFNTSKIMVPVGSSVTIRFDNQDANIPHNVAIYTDDTAKTAIFKGEIITGPGEIDYTFDAPATPGTYFFRCDIHPQMNGQFIVQ